MNPKSTKGMGSGLSARQAASPSASSKGKATSTSARQPAPSPSSKSGGRKHVDLCEIKVRQTAQHLIHHKPQLQTVFPIVLRQSQLFFTSFLVLHVLVP